MDDAYKSKGTREKTRWDDACKSKGTKWNYACKSKVSSIPTSAACCDDLQQMRNPLPIILQLSITLLDCILQNTATSSFTTINYFIGLCPSLLFKPLMYTVQILATLLLQPLSHLVSLLLQASSHLVSLLLQASSLHFSVFY